ncbi:hypothetical protein [Dongshaea marina]|uniref:hypothetical protein n=1 Tax=Dongshaea marina TaxID=2047966 RepID=UPI000D3E20ED|nr:hypothetical protein [Dongshaea marina]
MKYKGVEISTYALHDQISGHWIGKYDISGIEPLADGLEQSWTQECFDSEDDALLAAIDEAKHRVDQMK